MRWLLEGAESSSQLLGRLWWGPGISYLVKSQVWTSYLRNSLACLCLCEASGRLAQLLNRLSVLRPAAGGESHSLCVCLWVWIPATGTNQELTGFKQRHTSRNDRNRQVQTIQQYTEGYAKCGESQAWRHIQGPTDSSKAPDNLTNQATEQMTCSWISFENRDHTKEDI